MEGLRIIRERATFWADKLERKIRNRLKSDNALPDGFEIARIDRWATKLPYDIFVDEFGKNRKSKSFFRKSKPVVPKVWVLDGEHEICISLSETPEILMGKESEFKKLQEIKAFLSNHLFAFRLQWEGTWTSFDLSTYCHSVGKKKMSKEEAVNKLFEDGMISEMPPENFFQ